MRACVHPWPCADYASELDRWQEAYNIVTSTHTPRPSVSGMAVGSLGGPAGTQAALPFQPQRSLLAGTAETSGAAAEGGAGVEEGNTGSAGAAGDSQGEVRCACMSSLHVQLAALCATCTQICIAGLLGTDREHMDMPRATIHSNTIKSYNHGHIFPKSHHRMKISFIMSIETQLQS